MGYGLEVGLGLGLGLVGHACRLDTRLDGGARHKRVTDMRDRKGEVAVFRDLVVVLLEGVQGQ